MIHSNVSVRERVTIGDRVILQNGVVIGGDGYVFVRRGDGTHEKIPQVATVVIEDDVELGANTTVDRRLWAKPASRREPRSTTSCRSATV